MTRVLLDETIDGVFTPAEDVRVSGSQVQRSRSPFVDPLPTVRLSARVPRRLVYGLNGETANEKNSQPPEGKTGLVVW